MSFSPSLPVSVAWSAPRRLAFRFLFVYLLAYSFPFPLSALPYGPSAANTWFESVWAPFVRWFGVAVVRLPEAITVLPNGSGDTTFDWVECAAFLALGCVGALIWTALGRSASSHPRLAAFLRGYLRYVLAVAMLGYGMAKVVPQQFSAPSLDRLTSTYGESSPMGLLWTFMGASSAYQFFAGAMEVLAGLLLLMRRTAVVGALVACGVLTNVVMLNFCFDVPVKLYSSHLLLMAGLIALPDTRRLFQAVVLGREVPAANVSEVFGPPRARRVVRIATALFVLSILWGEARGALAALGGAGAPRGPSIQGLWRVEHFARDGVEVPLLADRPELWRRVSISPYGWIMIRRMDDASERFRGEVDEAASTLLLRIPGRNDVEPRHLIWTHPSPDVLTLDGSEAGVHCDWVLRRVPEGSFLLTNRGFHWVNEAPLNR